MNQETKWIDIAEIQKNYLPLGKKKIRNRQEKP